MKKDNKILKNRDFTKVIKNGSKCHTQTLSFYYLPNQNNNFRIGITISKKVSKLAVVRNKIKRQLLAILDKHYDKNKKLDIVIIVKPNSTNNSFNEFELEIKRFISKIK